MLIPAVDHAIKQPWDVEDPYGGGISRVLEGLVLVQFKDGSFGVLNLDANDGEPFFGEDDQSYVSTLKCAEELLRGWRESYQESPTCLERLLKG